MRHVTRSEVSARYLIPESTMSGWKKQLENFIHATKGSRYSKPDQTCGYPEMEEKLFERLWEH